MRHLAVYLVAATSMLAADYTTGQAARLVIGQPTFTIESPVLSDTILGGAGGVAYANGVLVVADANRVAAGPINPRVLIYRNVQNWLPNPTAELPQGQRCSVCFTPQPDVIMGKKETVDDVEQYTVGLSSTAFRLPTHVATDGVRLAVADSDSNRVLLWNTLPTSKDTPADVVLGQPDMVTDCPNAIGKRDADGACPGDVRAPNQKSLRSPQGVWIHNGMIFVADDQNHRIMIWKTWPTQNFQNADMVLGAPNFTTTVELDLSQKTLNAKADTLLNPVSVTTDGTRLYVADLGHSRVLIWNTMPTQNGQPADVVVGQPDMTSAVANNVSELCEAIDEDDEGDPIYPYTCAKTMNFPRFAISDGTRLFVADGGNDRILVYNTIPTADAVPADVILGQINDQLVQTSDDDTGSNPDAERRSASDTVRTPLSLALDGTNLLVAGAFERRILAFTPAPVQLPLAGIRNAASLNVYAVGSITFAGTITENNKATITIMEAEYTYTIKKNDTMEEVAQALADLINAGDGDPWVVATLNPALGAIILTSRIGGETGNETTYSVETSPSTTATILLTAAGSTLAGGRNAAKLAAGTLVSLFGDNLADLADGETVGAPGVDPLPNELAGVRLYIDGTLAPLLSVSKTQINAQIPWEVLDATSCNAYVRTRGKDGSVRITTALGIPLVTANPGVFAIMGAQEPRPAIALHASSRAVGNVIIEGTEKTGEKVTVTIGEEPNAREYSYTMVDDDTRYILRDKLIELINASDPEVYAEPGGQFPRVLLRARVEGPAGNGIKYSAKSAGSNINIQGSTDALCCANIAGAPVTDDNPAVPGENIIVYATGLGMVGPDEAKFEVATGFSYKGPALNTPYERMDAIAGGKTANVLKFGMKPGTVGVYEIVLELLSSLPTNPLTQGYVMQGNFISNIFTFPVLNPNPEE